MDLKRFDIVQIKTIERVTWLSGPASRPATPQGNWIVYAGVGMGDDIMIVKDETVAQIPASDVFKVADYGTEHALEHIKKIRTASDLKKYPLTPIKETSDGKEGKGRPGRQA